MTLHPRVSTYAAEARFNSKSPREGCQLTYGQADAARGSSVTRPGQNGVH